METVNNNPSFINVYEKVKNYAQPDTLCHTFDLLSNLHKLLPNHMVEVLHSYRSESDKIKYGGTILSDSGDLASGIKLEEAGENSEFSGLEKVLARHQLPREVSLTPKPSKMPSWKRKIINNISGNWRKCHMWKKNTYEPPMSTIIARWAKKNMRPTEDLKSVVQRLSALGPIVSVTPCGRQSAVVVFKDTTSACKAVSAFPTMSAGTMFQCSWQHRFMSRNETPFKNIIRQRGFKNIIRKETTAKLT